MKLILSAALLMAAPVFAGECLISRDPGTTWPGKVKVALTVATTQPILYPVAPIAASANLATAQRFVDFLGSPPAQAVLTKYGFGRP